MEQDFILSDEYRKFIKVLLVFYIIISLLAILVTNLEFCLLEGCDPQGTALVTISSLSFLSSFFLFFLSQGIFKTKNKKNIKKFSFAFLFIVLFYILLIVGFKQNYFLYNLVNENKILHCVLTTSDKKSDDSWYDYAYKCSRAVEEANKRKAILENARLNRDYQTLCKFENGSIYMDANECVSLIKDIDLQKKCVERALKDGDNNIANICDLF